VVRVLLTTVPPNDSTISATVEVQQLDRDAVTTDEARLEGDVVDLHELSELLAHGMGLHELEAQTLAIETNRSFEIAHTDPHVRERHPSIPIHGRHPSIRRRCRRPSLAAPAPAVRSLTRKGSDGNLAW
jgi:hypothetical protein